MSKTLRNIAAAGAVAFFIFAIGLAIFASPADLPPAAAKCGKPDCRCGCKEGKPCTCKPAAKATTAECCCAAEAMASLDGVYLVEGTDAKAPYIGAATITRIGDVYRAQVIVGGTASIGIALRNGDTLSLSWEQRGDVRGVTVYRIGAKSLTGRWASVPGNGQVYSETLTFLRSFPDTE